MLSAEEHFKRHGVEVIRVGKGSFLDVESATVNYLRVSDGVEPEEVHETATAPPVGRWLEALSRMLNYLRRGAPAVVILDPPTESASVYRLGFRPEIFEKHQTLTLPDVLPGFEVPVSSFFEE